MNQVVEDNGQDIKCNQKSVSKNDNKKTKESSETNDEINLLNQENLNDSLVNSLHNYNINSSLTNGTCDHNDEDNSNISFDSKSSIAQDHQFNLDQEDVDSVHYCHDLRHQKAEEIKAVRNLVEALETLESALSLGETPSDEIEIVSYESDLQMPEIMRLIQKDLSEPYSIYTYRYFIHNWPKLCFLAMHEGKCIGAIVCKLDLHHNVVKRGYIAMLAVDEKYRKRKIGSKLVRKAIQAMQTDNADEVVLETEITNKPALKLYENLGFVRDKRLFRYYLNGVDALRLKLWLR